MIARSSLGLVSAAWRDRRPPTRFAVAWTATMSALLGFTLLAWQHGTGSLASLDSRILLLARSLRFEHPWLASVLRDLSGIGSTVSLTLATCAFLIHLVIIRRRSLAMLVGASILGATGTVRLLKLFFHRARPDAGLAEYVESGLSFPSGHTSMSSVVLLTLAVVMARTRTDVAERLLVLSTGAVIALLIGASRAFLGVHWATDVLGGWAFGVAWVGSFVLLVFGLDPSWQRRAPTARAVRT